MIISSHNIVISRHNIIVSSYLSAVVHNWNN